MSLIIDLIVKEEWAEKHPTLDNTYFTFYESEAERFTTYYFVIEEVIVSTMMLDDFDEAHVRSFRHFLLENKNLLNVENIFKVHMGIEIGPNFDSALVAPYCYREYHFTSPELRHLCRYSLFFAFPIRYFEFKGDESVDAFQYFNKHINRLANWNRKPKPLLRIIVKNPKSYIIYKKSFKVITLEEANFELGIIESSTIFELENYKSDVIKLGFHGNQYWLQHGDNKIDFKEKSELVQAVNSFVYGEGLWQRRTNFISQLKAQ